LETGIDFPFSRWEISHTDFPHSENKKTAWLSGFREAQGLIYVGN